MNSEQKDRTDEQSEEATDNLLDAVENLKEVDEKSKDASLNKHSITDNNGRRIELDRSKMVRPPTQGVFSTDHEFKKVNPDSKDSQE